MVNATDNLHSQLVGLGKIVLPLAALALLSTLFLFARNSGSDESIPYAEIGRLAEEQRITDPSFSGVTDNGAVVVIGAASAKPDADDPRRIEIVSPRMTLDAADGTKLRITAGGGVLDTHNQQAELTGLARLKTSDGYTMETGGLDADLDTGVVTSRGPLEIEAPFGSLTAGHVTAIWAENGDGQQLRFADGVKLVYQPPQRDE